MSSLLNVHCGLGRREIIDAVSRQLSELSYSTIERITHPAAVELSNTLTEITPENLTRVFYTNSGSEAVETAIKVVRQYSKLKGTAGKYKIIALEQGYHGVSMGALSASGIESIREPYEPLLGGFVHIPPAYCYRCSFGKNYPDCDLECAGYLEEKILEEGPETIGGFLLEPVMGVSGVIVPPHEYFQKIESICRKYDVLLMFDEIITGFGRIGTMFAADHFCVKPDIMALSKGINSGYLPFGATMITGDIYNTFLRAKAREGVFSHGSTTNGHPACCASASANINIILKEKLHENAREIGAYLLSKIQKYLEYSIVGQIRGIGLLMAVELVQDKKSKNPLTSQQMDLIAGRLLKSGLYTYYFKNNLFIAPPLIFTREEADYTFEVYDKTLSKAAMLLN